MAIGVIATACLVPWLGGSIFNDEGASLYSAHLSWSALWNQSGHVDLVFLPYYAFLHLWMGVSDNIAWLRAPSLAAYGVAVVVVGRIGLRVGGTWCGVVAAVLTATNTLLVEKALNVRPYALSTAAVALAAAALVAWLEDGRSRRLWIFCAWTLAATALQIFSFLAPAAMVLGVLIARPTELRHRARAMLAPFGTMVALVVAWAAVTSGQVSQVNWIARSTTSALIANSRGPAIGNLYDLSLLLIACATVLLLTSRWWHGGRLVVATVFDKGRDVLVLSSAWALLPTIALLVASFIHPIYWDRYVTASAPGLALAVAVVCAPVIALARTSRRPENASVPARSPWWLSVLGVVLLGLLAGNYWTAASTVTQDLRGLAAYVAHHARPGDEIVLFDHSTTAAVDYYLQRDGHNIRHWPQVGLRQPLVEAFALDTSKAAIDQAPQRLWVVNEGGTSATYAREVLHAFYPWERQVELPGVTLSLFSRTDPNAPAPPPSQRVILAVPTVGAVLSGRQTLWAAVTPGARTVHFEVSGRGLHHTVVSGSVPATYGICPARVCWRGSWNTAKVHRGTYVLRSVASYAHGLVVTSAGTRISVRN